MSNSPSSSKNFSTASLSRALSFLVVTFLGSVSSFSGLRLIAITCAPFSYNILVVDSPIPEVPPNTIAFFPLIFIVI